MRQMFATIVAFLPAERVASTRSLIDALGNPANPRMAKALDELGRVHFASLNVFEASAVDRGILVFEFSADGKADQTDELLKALDDRLGADLAAIFAVAEDRGKAPLHAFWATHAVKVSQRPFGNPGLEFSGTPGLSVDRIRRERDLVRHIAALLPAPQPGTPATTTLAATRAVLAAEPAWRWALEPEALAQGGSGGDVPDSMVAAIPTLVRLLPRFIPTFGWPLLPIPIAIFLVSWWALGLTCSRAVGAALITAPLAVLFVALVLLVFYRVLRRRENAEIPVDRPPEPGAVAAIMARENYAAQNHLAALSVMKPGLLRRLTLTVVLWMAGQLAARYYRPGFLGSLGTIHFARWVMVPGTDDLLFLSNYGGSWESYLEDFITKAHTGLTGIWSNTIGFPRTSNLLLEGATDGERFKRWARRQQIPTAFWYSAYPDLTTANIRTNAVIRQGLGTVMTEDEAQQWLAQFGSETRPQSTIESSEIQSLVLGGMGFLREGAALVFALSDDVATAKGFLGELLPTIAFSDGRSHDDATVIALTASALKKFGLPDDSMATFPPTFIDGMAAPWRARVLGDVRDNDPKEWWWGDSQRQPMDGVLLLYAKTHDALQRRETELSVLLRKYGHALHRTIPFQPLPDRHAASADETINAKAEPFGFVDGVSQPMIRGTYKALRGADPIHLVEAGEFILGYPDNRGHIPPTPSLAAIHDPANVLPVTAEPAPDFSTNTVSAERDLGRNGSFLVIRQLEQNIEEFWAYCTNEGNRLKPQFPLAMSMPAEEFIAAKIVGRWRDGSPLVRYPRWPAERAPLPARPLARSGGGTALQAQNVAQIPASAAAIRAERHPRPAVRQPTPGATPSSGAPAGARGKAQPPFEPDNDFLFGAEDPQGLRCPFGAHIRRANPRESFAPGSREQIDITNRHRIIRIGRFYTPQQGQNKGLFFMCLNGDIERQFEFVQQTWVQASSFQGLSNERDPLIGDHQRHGGYTIPTHDGPMRLANLPTFVRTRGGGYFFLPGRRTLQYLAS